MENVEIKVEGNKLIITVDLTKDQGLSSTRKSHIVGTTRGLVKLASTMYKGPEISIGLNVIKALA